MDLLARFSDLAISGELKSALQVLQAIIRAKRHDVLSRYAPMYVCRCRMYDELEGRKNHIVDKVSAADAGQSGH